MSKIKNTVTQFLDKTEKSELDNRLLKGLFNKHTFKGLYPMY